MSIEAYLLSAILGLMFARFLADLLKTLLCVSVLCVVLPAGRAFALEPDCCLDIVAAIEAADLANQYALSQIDWNVDELEALSQEQVDELALIRGVLDTIEIGVLGVHSEANRAANSLQNIEDYTSQIQSQTDELESIGYSLESILELTDARTLQVFNQLLWIKARIDTTNSHLAAIESLSVSSDGYLSLIADQTDGLEALFGSADTKLSSVLALLASIDAAVAPLAPSLVSIDETLGGIASDVSDSASYLLAIKGWSESLAVSASEQTSLLEQIASDTGELVGINIGIQSIGSRLDSDAIVRSSMLACLGDIKDALSASGAIDLSLDDVEAAIVANGLKIDAFALVNHADLQAILGELVAIKGLADDIKIEAQGIADLLHLGNLDRKELVQKVQDLRDDIAEDDGVARQDRQAMIGKLDGICGKIDITNGYLEEMLGYLSSWDPTFDGDDEDTEVDDIYIPGADSPATHEELAEAEGLGALGQSVDSASTGQLEGLEAKLGGEDLKDRVDAIPTDGIALPGTISLSYHDDFENVEIKPHESMGTLVLWVKAVLTGFLLWLILRFTFKQTTTVLSG